MSAPPAPPPMPQGPSDCHVSGRLVRTQHPLPLLPPSARPGVIGSMTFWNASKSALLSPHASPLPPHSLPLLPTSARLGRHPLTQMPPQSERRVIHLPPALTRAAHSPPCLGRHFPHPLTVIRFPLTPPHPPPLTPPHPPPLTPLARQGATRLSPAVTGASQPCFWRVVV